MKTSGMCASTSQSRALQSQRLLRCPLVSTREVQHEKSLETCGAQKRGQTLAELIVLVDAVGDVAAAHFAGLCGAEPRYHEEAPACARTAAQLEEELRVVEERSDLYAGRFDETRTRRGTKGSVVVSGLPICRGSSDY